MHIFLSLLPEAGRGARPVPIPTSYNMRYQLRPSAYGLRHIVTSGNAIPLCAIFPTNSLRKEGPTLKCMNSPIRSF